MRKEIYSDTGIYRLGRLIPETLEEMQSLVIAPTFRELIERKREHLEAQFKDKMVSALNTGTGKEEMIVPTTVHGAYEAWMAYRNLGYLLDVVTNEATERIARAALRAGMFEERAFVRQFEGEVRRARRHESGRSKGTTKQKDAKQKRQADTIALFNEISAAHPKWSLGQVHKEIHMRTEMSVRTIQRHIKNAQANAE